MSLGCGHRSEPFDLSQAPAQAACNRIPLPKIRETKNVIDTLGEHTKLRGVALTIGKGKTAGDPQVRDIDDWIFHFERMAAPRLKEIFEQDLDGMPEKIVEQLKRFRETEQQRLMNEPEFIFWCSDRRSLTSEK